MNAPVTASPTRSAIAERTARVSQERSHDGRASEMQGSASDDLEGAGGMRSPASSRLPGMHVGRDLLVAATVAITLYATLLLIAIRTE